MKRNPNTITDIFLNSTSLHKDKIWSFTVDKDLTYTYGQFADKCKELSDLLYAHGIGAGDKVAIFSAGTPNWSLAFFAATAFGRVAVPILPDFTGSEAEHVLTHSETRALFISSKQLPKLSEECLSSMELIIDIQTLGIIRDNGASHMNSAVLEPQPDDLAALIYTSGTTGQAKGVMLSHRNFVVNVIAGYDFYPLDNDDILLSILPLAHTYELSLGLLYPFSCGAQVCYTSKPPTPSYLMKVMQEIRPTAMLTVPLIIEKVYKSTIIPTIKKSKALSWMEKNMNTVLCRIIGKKMVKTFGGRMKFFGIGGAKLDYDVETFLHKAKFPYYIGYGLTECAPLLCLSKFHSTVPGSIGWPILGVELRLGDKNPQTGEGEIQARGGNIMPGYYKDPERTAEAFTEDGWFRTKDIACTDEQGRYFIKGRLGNMILGANGENIYPEEIEKVIKEIPSIEDALVISRENRLIGLVKVADSLFNTAEAEKDNKVLDAIRTFNQEVVSHVNARVNLSSRLHSVEMMKEPFNKTATMKIRRFLYEKDAPTIK